MVKIPILLLGDIQNFLYLFKIFSTTNISFVKNVQRPKVFEVYMIRALCGIIEEEILRPAKSLVSF